MIINYTELAESVKKLASAGAAFKGEMFKSAVKNEELDDDVIDDYLSELIEFIRKYTDYAESIDGMINDVKNNHFNVIIPYDSIKDFVYAKYDYASVLPFVDGVYHGLESKKFEYAADIEDFFDHTVNSAFKNRSNSVAGLLEDVAGLTDEKVEGGESGSELAKFKAVCGQTLFNRRDSKELYKAIEKCCQFLFIKFQKGADKIHGNPRLYTSIVNNCIEYMTYSAVAYGTRVYAIGLYINQANVGHTLTYAYKVEDAEPIIKTSLVEVMKNSDEAVFRDIEGRKKAVDLMKDWLTKLGAGPADEKDMEDRWRPILSRDNEPSNRFYQASLSNALVQYLDSHKYVEDLEDWRASDLATVMEELGKLIHNKTQALTGSTSPKQDLLVIIKSVRPQYETAESYSKLAANLTGFFSDLSINMRDLYGRAQAILGDIRDYPNGSLSTSSSIRLCVDIMKEVAGLYREFGVAVYMRARDIEDKVNELRGVESRKLAKDLTIKIPGKKKEKVDDVNSAFVTPDTTPTSAELTALHALPILTEAEMYDEYVKTMPGMEGTPYFEASGISTIINAIMAMLKSLVKRWSNFFGDKQIQAAVKWCKEHQNQMLNEMTYAGEMDVLPYKANINIEYIEKMITAINNFSKDNISSDDKANAFVKSLYPEPAIADMFALADKKNDEKATIYKNWLLFGRDVKSTEEVKAKHIQNDAEIKKELAIWFGNITDLGDTQRSLTNTQRKIDSAINNLKSKVNDITKGGTEEQKTQDTTGGAPKPEEGNEGEQDGTGTPPPSPVSGENNNGETGAPPTPNSDEEKAKDQENKAGTNNISDTASKVLAQTQSAIQEVWGLLYDAITSAVKTQYGYIQQAYALAQKNK